MRRIPVGISLAWLAIILIFPFVGAGLYLFIGEYRLGRHRRRRFPEIHQLWRDRLGELCADREVDGARLDEPSLALSRLVRSAFDTPPLPGNQIELLRDAQAAFPALLADIERAQQSCNLEFYIWTVGGQADEVAAALLRAAARGVICRVLVDAIGSGRFLRSRMARDLRRGGVQLQAAFPAGLIRLLFVRPDLRMHRKIAVIDGQTAYTGSLNLADPRYFKKSAGVGQWVDALVRVQGPAVGALALTFLEDWALETGESLAEIRRNPEVRSLPEAGPAVVQVIPSGPDQHTEAIEQVVLLAIYSASHELVLTTPYFVPSESLLTALLTAAARGVKVTLVVPARVDSRLVRFASQAHQADLLEAGVRVALFQDGLLHTKSITVDERFSLFGSLNLDPRSLRLDFEITLVVYDRDFNRALRQLQQTYLDRSQFLDTATCNARSAVERFAEDTARLAGPLL
jgi:cardiolipin synthase